MNARARGSASAVLRRGVAAALLGLAACAEPVPTATPAADAAPSTSWPEGTVLVVEGVPVSAAEVEAATDAMADLNPKFTRRAARRHAVIAQLVPRIGIRALHAEAAEEARRALEADLEALRRGAEDAPEPKRIVGTPVNLGFDPWRHADAAPIGTWSGPHEYPGAWFAIRVLERSGDPDGPHDNREELVLELVERVYMGPEWRVWDAEDQLGRIGVRPLTRELDEALPLAFRERLREVLPLPAGVRR